MMDRVVTLSMRAEWAGIGTFGLTGDVNFLRCLPKSSQLVVGLPQEIEKHSTLLLKLRVTKKQFPHLSIATRTDYHAKYALIRTKKAKWIVLGSANFTSSPAHETCIVLKDEETLWNKMVKLHEWWWINGSFIEPDQTQRLSPQGLAALSTTSVSR